MKAIDLATRCVLVSCIWLAPTHTGAEEPAVDNAGKAQIEGATITIELPPDGKEIQLPMRSRNHATLIFDIPVVDVLGKPQGAVARKAKHRDDRVDIWPEKLKPGSSSEELEPLAGNFRVELEDRTISVSIFEPADPRQTIHLVNVRSTPGQVETLEQKVKEARDDAASAREAAAEARREANEAKQEARAAAARARVAAARAEAGAKKAEAETASAKADAAKAKADAAKAEAEAAQARADAEEARAVAAEAIARAEAAEARRNQAIGEMLLHAARELVDGGGYRLLPEGGFREVMHDHLGAEFRHGTWQDGYFLLESVLRVPHGRPFHLGEVRARLENGKRIPLRIVTPRHAEAARGNVITTVFPGRDENMVFAIEVPVNQDTDGIELELYQASSEAPPIAFQIARYPDGVIMYPETEEQERRRLWAKQVVVGPRVALGGCWLSSGQEGDTELDTTRCTAVGASIAKGLHEYVAVGVDVLGSWSGDVRFDGEPDDLTRDATLVRALAFGDVRFSGGKIVPYLRLGTGVQLIRYGGSADASTDVVLTYAVGGGVVYRLGENISAGLTTQFISSQDGMFRSLDAGIHLSYGWNP